jgi:hypothetical protein
MMIYDEVESCYSCTVDELQVLVWSEDARSTSSPLSSCLFLSDQHTSPATSHKVFTISPASLINRIYKSKPHTHVVTEHDEARRIKGREGERQGVTCSVAPE